MTWFRVKLAEIFLWGFRSILIFFGLFGILFILALFHFLFSDVVDLIDLFLEIFEEAIETQLSIIPIVFWFHNMLISFWNFGELSLSLRSRVVLRVIFNWKFSIGIFDLIYGSILADLKNLVCIHLLLNLLREVLSEEFLFFFELYLVLLEELLENFMRIMGLVMGFTVFIVWRSIVDFDLPCWHLNSSLEGEEWVMEIEEGS